MERLEQREDFFLGVKIVAYKTKRDVYDGLRQRFVSESKIHCVVYRKESKHPSLSLCECNDGSKFTSVNQAVNQAKEHIKSCVNHGW